MKKIININLSGRVIPIEDTAYEKLQAYIESLRRYFVNEEGRDEIINDIESRIAELMDEKVRKGASCVTDVDVDVIIGSMGRPEDFDAETAEAASESTGQEPGRDYSSTEKRSRKRLYRDSSDKFIGGVCSGIANYLNTDPAIVRILFAIITFGGFGLGFLIYILLWMFLPTSDLENYSGKRLYRNPDDRIIGGVAGGLAAYFNTRTSTIRLIFAAPIVLSLFLSILSGMSWRYGFDLFPNIFFGSLSGTFILAYVILWMVLPEARSTYEKMEMRGEKVDVKSIRQNVREGMDNVKDRVKDWSGEVKESAQNLSSKAREFAGTRGKKFASEVNETVRNGGRGLGHAIGVLFKVFFLFIAGTIAFGLFVAVIALIFGGVAWWPVNDFLWTSKWQQTYAWGTLIFFLLVPLVGFITWIIRRILRVRSRHSYLGWTFGCLWTIGWITATLFAISISKDFREHENVDVPVNIEQPATGKMVVVVSEPELSYTGRFSWIDDDSEGWDLTDDTARLSAVKFNIIKSFDDQYHVILRKYSFGKTEDEALARAEKIQYAVYSKDSVLDLSSGYAFDKDSKFRGQEVEIEIQVPAGKKINFDQTVPDKLNPTNFKLKKKYRHRTTISGRVITDYSYDNYYFRFRPGVDYEMGIDGNLKDPSGKTVNENDYYRYDTDSNDSLSIQRRLEEEKRKRDESEKSIKPAPGTTENTAKRKERFIAANSSPVFSLVQRFF